MQLNFSAHKLSAFGGLAAIREYERDAEALRRARRGGSLELFSAKKRQGAYVFRAGKLSLWKKDRQCP